MFEVQSSEWSLTYTSRFKILISLVFFFSFQKSTVSWLSVVQQQILKHCFCKRTTFCDKLTFKRVSFVILSPNSILSMVKIEESVISSKQKFLHTEVLFNVLESQNKGWNIHWWIRVKETNHNCSVFNTILQCLYFIAKIRLEHLSLSLSWS